MSSNIAALEATSRITTLSRPWLVLANGRGGTLFIGVDDDRSISGCYPWHGERTDPAKLEALIQNRTRPSLPTQIEVLSVEGVDVVVIKIPDQDMPVGTSRGVYQRRAMKTDGTPECIAYEPHDLLLSQFSASGKDWAELPALSASMSDLDPQEFDRFRRLCAAASGDRSLAELADVEILRALALTDPLHGGSPTLGAILLFGTEEAIARWVPNHEVAFQVLERTRLKTNDLLRSPLFKVAEELQERLEARNTEDEMQLGLLRLSLPRIPMSVAREAIANALVHRDYTSLGPVSVSLKDDAFSVSSPGGFPRGITMENLLDSSQPRSRALADAFKRAGLVERSGRGVSIMYREMLRLGRNEPDYSRSSDTRVVVTFPVEAADKDLVAYVHGIQTDGHELTLNELRVLHILRVDGAVTLMDLTDDLDTPKSQLRPVLNRMEEKGMLEVRGSGRNREYHLPPAFYENAVRRSDYVRSVAVEAMRREEMVLKYIREFGRITRREAAELCGISTTAASQLLRSMAASGDIQMQGERRGAHYMLTDSTGGT
ncbi:DNA glycosylase AlkZ-like family protein [Arthrobacter sp. NPDC055138]